MDKCQICFCSYTDPKLLPCLDTFCFSCLDEYVTKHRNENCFTCPSCKVDILIPSGGIDKFENNLHVLGKQIQLTENETHPCEICEDRLQAENRCIECQQNFCAICSKSHLKLKIAKTHTLVKITGEDGKRYLTSTGYCDKHKTEELTFFCRTCMAPICLRCRLTNHENHTTDDIEDFANTLRKDLREVLHNGKTLRISMLNEIDEMRTYEQYLAKKSREIVDNVAKRRDQFHAAVDRICDAMLLRLQTDVDLERVRIENDRGRMENELVALTNKIATTSHMIDLGSHIEIVRKRKALARNADVIKRETNIILSGAKMELDFTFQPEAENSIKYLIGRLIMDVRAPDYIRVEEVSCFRVDNKLDVINSICPSPDGRAWVACGWRPEIHQFDKNGYKSRSKRVGRDVDSIAIDRDGNAYVTCRDERTIKRFDKNFKRRMASLPVEYPRGVACTQDCKLIICVTESTTYFDYNTSHRNRLMKIGPDGDESYKINSEMTFMYPIRVAVNMNGNIVVSDNLQHIVIFLNAEGEVLTTYDAEQKTHDIALVHSPTTKYAISNLQSRQEQDGPSSRPSTNESSDGMHQYREAPQKSLDSVPSLGPPANTISELQVESASVTECMSDINVTEHVPLFDPRGITCDRYGHVIVADYSSNLIHLLDSHGRFLSYLVTGNDGIFAPTSVAVDEEGLLWVGCGDATVKIYKYIDRDRIGRIEYIKL